MGTNSAGLLNKTDSLASNINKSSPAVIFIQETKVSGKGQIKVNNYQIFEVVRSKSSGGSFLTGVHKYLNPVFISGVEDEIEILVVQGQTNGVDIRFINGPQENTKIEDKIVRLLCLH